MKNKLLVYVAIGILLANAFPTAALAVENHNSSRSNKTYPLALQELGVGAEGIEEILGATDVELLALIAYKGVRGKLTGTLRSQGGVGGAAAESVVNEIVEMNKGEEVRVKPIRVEFKSIAGGANNYGINDEGIKRLNNSVNNYGINDEGIKRLNAGLGGLIQSALDYNAARGNVITAMKKYGVKDDQIPGLLDIVYAPIKIADAIGDYFGPALESYPFLGNIVGNERMNVHLSMSTPGHRTVGKATFSVVTRNNKVETVTYGEIPNLGPTLNIYIDQEAVEQITAGKMTLPDAMLQGKMRYEGVGFFGSVKVLVGNAILGVYNTFSAILTNNRGSFAVSGKSDS